MSAHHLRASSRRTRITVVAVVAALGSVTACSSDDEGTTTAAATASAPVEATTATSATATVPAAAPATTAPAGTAGTGAAELAMTPFAPAISCTTQRCPTLAVSDLGTVVAYDPAASTLTWYEDLPRTVAMNDRLDPALSEIVVVGPGDVAYLSTPTGGPVELLDLVAVGPDGATISFHKGGVELPTMGLIATAPGVASVSSPDSSRVVMQWQLPSATTTVPNYPTVRQDGAAWRFSLGDGIDWLVPASAGQLQLLPLVHARGDDGVAAALREPSGALELVEMHRDETMSVTRFPVPGTVEHPVVAADGSLIGVVDGNYVRFSPPAEQLSPQPTATNG